MIFILIGDYDDDMMMCCCLSSCLFHLYFVIFSFSF